jgi:hypothetical protein
MVVMREIGSDSHVTRMNSAMASCDLSRKRPDPPAASSFLFHYRLAVQRGIIKTQTDPSMYNSALQLRSEKTNCAAKTNNWAAAGRSPM